MKTITTALIEGENGTIVNVDLGTATGDEVLTAIGGLIMKLSVVTGVHTALIQKELTLFIEDNTVVDNVEAEEDTQTKEEEVEGLR